MPAWSPPSRRRTTPKDRARVFSLCSCLCFISSVLAVRERPAATPTTMPVAYQNPATLLIVFCWGNDRACLAHEVRIILVLRKLGGRTTRSLCRLKSAPGLQRTCMPFKTHTRRAVRHDFVGTTPLDALPPSRTCCPTSFTVGCNASACARRWKGSRTPSAAARRMRSANIDRGVPACWRADRPAHASSNTSLMRATVCRSKQTLLTFTGSLLNLLPPMRPAFCSYKENSF